MRSPARSTGRTAIRSSSPVRLSGDTLTFAGDSAGENFSVHIDSTGTLKADGTMTGTLKARFVDFNDAHEVVRKRDQEIPWTAARGEHGIVHFPR